MKRASHLIRQWKAIYTIKILGTKKQYLDSVNIGSKVCQGNANSIPVFWPEKSKQWF